MKLNFKQKVAIQYYKTKFKAISLVSNKSAAKSLFKLFCTPYSGKPLRKEPAFFKKATVITVNYKGNIIRGWNFIPANCNGKKILVEHGFDSCSYKSEAIITKLYLSGFEVLAFDTLGHGVSDGKTVHAKQFAEIMILINKEFKNIYAIVTHSFSGLAVALAAEVGLKNIEKLVLIAPATETFRAIDNFFKFLDMPLYLKPALHNAIKEMSGEEVAHFSVTRAIKNITQKTLWVHDTKDFICPIEDILPTQNLKLSNVEFYITTGLGHNTIYRNPNVLQKIAFFLMD